MNRRCSVCRRAGHTARMHADLSPDALAELKQDGLEYLGRGFRELGEPHPDGDLLNQLAASVEAARLDRPESVRSLLGQALREVVHRPGVFEDHRVREAVRASAGPECDCPDGESWHPLGSAGCVGGPAEVSDERLVEDVVLPDVIVLDAPELSTSTVTSIIGGPEPTPGYSRADADQLAEDGMTVGAHELLAELDQEFVPDAEGGAVERDPKRFLVGEHGPEMWTISVPADALAHDGRALLNAFGEHGPQYVPWRTPLGLDGPLRITLPGVYDLTAEQYHDPDVTGDWLSNSDARQLIDDGCPAQFRYDRDHGVKATSEAFAVGHAVHSAILGKGEAIAVRPLVNPADPKQEWDSWRTNAAKAWRAEQEKAGRSVITPEQAEIVDAMAAAVHDDRWAHALLSQPGRPEMALFWVCPETGVQRRALVDYLPTGVNQAGVMLPVDIKSAESVAPTTDMEKKVYDHAWHRQATTIADGIIALGLARDVDFYFVVQSKKAPHLVTVVRLDAEAQRIGRIENNRALLVYKECLATGVWPDYADEPVTLGVPAWIARQYEEEVY